VVRKARNVFVLKFGGLTKRPGTQLVAEVLDEAHETRIIPFQFSLTQTYALEFGQGYMSPCANGGRLVEVELAVTHISNATTAQVSAAYHGYTAGDNVYFDGVAGAMGALLNGRSWPVLSVQSAGLFTIGANTAGVAAFSGSDGGVTRTGAPDPGPTPPVVPTPVPEPEPPSTIGGGGNGWYRRRIDGEEVV
jgi:hypothetical protein